MTISGTFEVPWFPTCLQDFELIGKKTLTSGDGIQATDHPGFKDPEYRARKAMITEAANSYKLSDSSLPKIDYNNQEKAVWKFCYDHLSELYKTNACREYN